MRTGPQDSFSDQIVKIDLQSVVGPDQDPSIETKNFEEVGTGKINMYKNGSSTHKFTQNTTK